jgi:hypothetical protein
MESHAMSIAGLLVAVAPSIGIARTVYAAPELALVLGFDVDDLIERGLDRPGAITTAHEAG